jgi:hypothetical protein
MLCDDNTWDMRSVSCLTNMIHLTKRQHVMCVLGTLIRTTHAAEHTRRIRYDGHDRWRHLGGASRPAPAASGRCCGLAGSSPALGAGEASRPEPPLPPPVAGPVVSGAAADACCCLDGGSGGRAAGTADASPGLETAIPPSRICGGPSVAQQASLGTCPGVSASCHTLDWPYTRKTERPSRLADPKSLPQ